MGKAVLNITAEDNASAVIDRINAKFNNFTANANKTTTGFSVMNNGFEQTSTSGAKTNAVFDLVTKRLGIFNREGLATGISFAVITKGIDLAMQGFQMLINYLVEGVEKNREYQLSIIYLKNNLNDFGEETIDTITDKMKSMSIAFGTSLNEMITNLRIFTNAGYDATEAINMMYNATLLSKVENIDMIGVQDAVITALNIFGYSYKSTGHIVQGFEDIMDATHLTIAEINNILSANSREIQDAALTWDEFKDIIYSVSKAGTTTGRTLTSDVRTAIEDINATVIKSIPKSKELTDEWTELADSASMHADVMKEIASQKQTDIGGGFDVGAWLESMKWDKSITLMHQLEEAGYDTAESVRNLYKTGKDSTEYTVLAGATEDNIKLTISMMEYNDSRKEQIRLNKEADIEEQAAHIDDLNKALTSFKSLLTVTNNELNLHNKNIEVLNKNISDAAILNEFNEDLRYMQMGLIDTSYASKIHNSTTRELILSIKAQIDTMEELNHANQKYSITEKKNSLELMRIQYDVMGQRRGATRSQKSMMDELERANMDLRIKTSENQLQMDEITMNMEPLQKRLELTKLWYNEEIYIVQDTYNKEILALQEKIATEEALLKESYENRKSIMAGISVTREKIANPSAKSVSYNPETGGITTVLRYMGGLGRTEGIAPIPKAQSGGYVSETGLAVIHRGETITPANKTSNNINVNVGGITIHSTGNEKYDADKLAQALSKAFDQKLITTNISNYRRR